MMSIVELKLRNCAVARGEELGELEEWSTTLGWVEKLLCVEM